MVQWLDIYHLPLKTFKERKWKSGELIGIRWVDLTFILGKISCPISKIWKTTKYKKKQENNVSTLHQHLWVGKISTWCLHSHFYCLDLVLEFSFLVFCKNAIWRSEGASAKISGEPIRIVRGIQMVHRKGTKGYDAKGDKQRIREDAVGLEICEKEWLLWSFYIRC